MRYCTAMLAMGLCIAAGASHAATRRPTGPLSNLPGMKQMAAVNAQADKTTAPAILVSTTISAGGEYGQDIAGGTVPLDVAKTIVCPGPNVCRIEAEQHVQFGSSSSGNSAAGNKIGVLSTVNGSLMMQPLPPFAGEVPTDGSYMVVNFAQDASQLAPGTYTVQSSVYSDGPASTGNYQITYRLYTQSAKAPPTK